MKANASQILYFSIANINNRNLIITLYECKLISLCEKITFSKRFSQNFTISEN